VLRNQSCKAKGRIILVELELTREAALWPAWIYFFKNYMNKFVTVSFFKQLGARCKSGFSDLQSVAKNYCVVQREPQNISKTNFTVSWDCPFNSGKSKQLNLESKALEDINRAYYNLNQACCTAFIGQ
jgi:hypothetical protein